MTGFDIATDVSKAEGESPLPFGVPEAEGSPPSESEAFADALAAHTEGENPVPVAEGDVVEGEPESPSDGEGATDLSISTAIKEVLSESRLGPGVAQPVVPTTGGGKPLLEVATPPVTIEQVHATGAEDGPVADAVKLAPTTHTISNSGTGNPSLVGDASGTVPGASEFGSTASAVESTSAPQPTTSSHETVQLASGSASVQAQTSALGQTSALAPSASEAPVVAAGVELPPSPPAPAQPDQSVAAGLIATGSSPDPSLSPLSPLPSLPSELASETVVGNGIRAAEAGATTVPSEASQVTGRTSTERFPDQPAVPSADVATPAGQGGRPGGASASMTDVLVARPDSEAAADGDVVASARERFTGGKVPTAIRPGTSQSASGPMLVATVNFPFVATENRTR